MSDNHYSNKSPRNPTITGFIISEFLHFLHIANVGLSVIALLGAGVLYHLPRYLKGCIIGNPKPIQNVYPTYLHRSNKVSIFTKT
jgi:hypothetical protein